MPVEPNDKPTLKLGLQPDGLRVQWGPSKGPWGIFREGFTPVNVEVNEWWLYVGTLKDANTPDGESEPIFSESLGTTTTKVIPKDLLPLSKTVVAQIIGYFESEKEDGEKFKEGIYSDSHTIEIK